MAKPSIHASADVSKDAKIGEDTKIWHLSQVREKASIGNNCILGKNVYIDHSVKIGSNVKIQNNSSIYHGAIIEDGVFIGPHVIITNDKTPRAINEDGLLKSDSDWEASKTTLKKGCSIGAGAIVLPGVTIGQFAMIGAGSVVTKDVSDFALVYGNPAAVHGKVNKKGEKQ